MTYDHDETKRTIQNLEARKRYLLEQVWPAAIEAAEADDHETLTELVRLKAQIEAIEYALTLKPKGFAGEEYVRALKVNFPS